MSTDVLARTFPNPDALHSKVSTPTNNTNPFAYENLEVAKRLAKGKFPIYLTSSKTNNQTYVMKVFTDTVQDSHEYYENEARFAFMSHPNVINIVHHQQERRLNYILSEYAPYGDFFDFIVNHKNELDEKLIRTYFRQLIDGIEYLHFVGIAHLDLKPENLLIGADFSLKIADFDLSYITGDSKVLSRGTKNYRAPEIYNSSSSNADLALPVAADIYSAGVILFLLKAGGMYPQAENRVIEGVNLTELMHKNHRKFWSKHCKMQGKEKSFFDSNFKELFHKMVKADPKKRYTIKKIKQSKWYNGPVYSPQELSAKMKSILKC